MKTKISDLLAASLLFFACLFPKCATAANPLAKNAPRIVFDSTRSGTFGIYSMNLDGSDVRVIVDSAKDDFNPSVSLTGKVVYLQAEKAGRDVPSDVWMVNVDGSGAEKIGSGASHVAISPKGDKVYFISKLKKIIEYDVSQKTKSRVFPNKKIEGSFKPQRSLAYLNVSPSGEKLAFITYIRGGWYTVSLNLKDPKIEILMRGCQPFWTRDEDALIYMTAHKDAPDERRIMKFYVDEKRAEVLQDRQPPWGYEYFPSLSPDGNTLLFAESRFDQRDFYSSNFQIFSKNLKTQQIVRITDDTFTNRYPRYLPSEVEAKKALGK